MSKTGYLEIIIGPMFSGKTTQLVELYEKYTIEGKLVAVINYVEDKRYHDNMLSTHDKKMIPCEFTSRLGDVWNTNCISNIHIADVILINEGQFFPDLVDTVLSMVEKYDKRVYVCGLDGDFKRNKFGTILDLIPLCDKVTKLAAKCHICNIPAIFSHRITGETGQIVIGSSNYIPVCRKCRTNFAK